MSLSIDVKPAAEQLQAAVPSRAALSGNLTLASEKKAHNISTHTVCNEMISNPIPKIKSGSVTLTVIIINSDRKG